MTNETAQPTNVGSNGQLGLSPERAAFEAWAAQRWGREAHRHTSATCAEWDAWQAGVRITVEAVRPPCGCQQGTCESKPDHECRMTAEIRAGDGAQ